MTIWKFPLSAETNVLVMPKGAKILTVHNQRDTPCLWAVVDPEASTETRLFEVVGTGHSFDDKGKQYIGTAHGILGYMVFHVFEKV